MGGCDVSSYEIFSDSGDNGAFVNNLDAASVANKPYLFEHTFTMPGAYTGSIVRYRL